MIRILTVTSEPGATPAEAVLCLRQAARVLVTSHSSPDGDAIGSQLAAAELIRQLGGSPLIINRDPTPANLSFLPGAETIVVREQLPEHPAGSFDLALVLECPNLERTGFPTWTGWAGLPILNIDHHLGNERFGLVNLVDEHAAAVGEMLLEVVDASGVELTPTMSTCLYTAIVTDTGDFRYSNTSPRVLSAASRLVARGAVPNHIAEALWYQVPERVVRLTATVLSTLRLFGEGKVAAISCDQDMLTRTGARPSDTEDLINQVRAIAGVEVAIFLKSFGPDIRVSLRSRGLVDVQTVAAEFGGGGHRNAAGCTLSTRSLVEAEKRIVGSLLAVLDAPAGSNPAGPAEPVSEYP
jgi:bifunctional oligoribonuclease and PAP phosphatase NrnA